MYRPRVPGVSPISGRKSGLTSYTPVTPRQISASTRAGTRRTIRSTRPASESDDADCANVSGFASAPRLPQKSPTSVSPPTSERKYVVVMPSMHAGPAPRNPAGFFRIATSWYSPSTGRSNPTPANRARLHGPVAAITTGAETSPRSVETPVTRPPAVRNRVARVCDRYETPISRARSRKSFATPAPSP